MRTKTLFHTYWNNVSCVLEQVQTSSFRYERAVEKNFNYLTGQYHASMF